MRKNITILTAIVAFILSIYAGIWMALLAFVAETVAARCWLTLLAMAAFVAAVVLFSYVHELWKKNDESDGED